MPETAPLQYATPRRPATLRPNGLALFAFLWTLAVTPAAVTLFFRAREWAASALSPTGRTAFAVAALVLAPAVAMIAGYVATERGAGWDSPYRWTTLAVVAVPLSSAVMSLGVMYWVGVLH
jgi:hypothetical protein